MIGALFLSAKLACIYLPNGLIIPEPRTVFIAGALPTPASYQRPHHQITEHYA